MSLCINFEEIKVNIQNKFMKFKGIHLNKWILCVFICCLILLLTCSSIDQWLLTQINIFTNRQSLRLSMTHKNAVIRYAHNIRGTENMLHCSSRPQTKATLSSGLSELTVVCNLCDWQIYPNLGFSLVEACNLLKYLW